MGSQYEIEIARTGDAVATNGTKINFTEKMLEDVAKSYDPLTFQAPLIITHDTKGIPDRKLASSPFAYGRPDFLRKVGDRLKAVFTQKIDPQVIGWFRQGNLLGISPSFYPPNHPHNPTPGKYHLRHIAALGKEPPSMKGLQPVNFSEMVDDSEVLDFMLPPESALDFSCACESMEPATVSLLVRMREYLIAEKGLDVANNILPLAAVERARSEAWESKKAIAALAEMQVEEALEEMEEEDEAEEMPYVEPYPVYSYKEPTKEKTKMGTKTKKRQDEDMMMLDDPLNEDASVLDEMEDYDQFEDEDEDMEEEEMPKKKAKSKSHGKSHSKTQDYSSKSQDYSELRQELNRRIRAIEADFSEKLSSLETELENQAVEFAEQKEELERQLSEQQLQALAQQCEVESKLLEFEEAKEQTRLESISSFVDGLIDDGVYPHLVGEISLDYSESEDGGPVTWELTDFLATLDDAQLEFAENFIAGMASALTEAQSVVNYSESSPAEPVVSESPVKSLGVNLPKGTGISPQAEAEAQLLMDFAEANGFDLTDKGQFKQAYKLLRKGGN